MKFENTALPFQPALVAMTVLAADLTLFVAASAAASASFAPAQDLILPSAVSAANDVRWESETQILMAVSGRGLLRVPLESGRLGTPETVVAQGGPPGIAIAAHLASSNEALAIAAPFSEMLWRLRAGGREGRLGTWWSEEPGTGISFFEDVDLHGRELAVLGLMRTPQGMSPDGAVAWRFTLDGATARPNPLVFALSGKGAKPFDACSIFGIGHVRYLPDGRLVVVPGAEPGVLVLAKDGSIVKTWDTSQLGVDVRCNMDEPSMRRLRSTESDRLAYLRRYSYVDEVLPTTYGPLVLVKNAAAAGHGSSWKGYLLRDGGDVLQVELPWTSSSPDARVAGDAAGDRILLLVSEVSADRPPVGGQLVVARLTMEKKPTASRAPSSGK